MHAEKGDKDVRAHFFSFSLAIRLYAFAVVFFCFRIGGNKNWLATLVWKKIEILF